MALSGELTDKPWHDLFLPHALRSHPSLPSLRPSCHVRVGPHDAGFLLLPHLPRQRAAHQGMEARVQPHTVDDLL